MFDYLIIGAGFAGSVLAERLTSQLNKKVLLVDKKNHIGGNAYDYYNENGILIHKYGPHIFHTNSKKVFDYLTKFTEWIPYFHHVLAVIEGKKVPIPFNLNTISQLFSVKYAEKIETDLINNYGFGEKIPILKLKEATSGELNKLAKYIYDNMFYGYTIKQWGLKPEELDQSVTARIPVCISKDNRYFYDTYQMMPKEGYSKLFKRMLSHKNIHILLKTEYKEIINQVKFDKLIYTGSLDEYFDYKYGELPYRSLEFEFKNVEMEYYQECAQVNYPNNNEFTRITEFKYLTDQKSLNSIVAFEYPKDYITGNNQIPYYPIPRKENYDLHNRYLKLMKKNKSIIYCGRLADYRYYNMDQTIARALSVFEKEIVQ